MMLVAVYASCERINNKKKSKLNESRFEILYALFIVQMQTSYSYDNKKIILQITTKKILQHLRTIVA